MSDKIDHTSKAQRRTIHIGEISLEVAMLPDGGYRLSQTEVAGLIDKGESSIRSFRSSKLFKGLPGKASQSAEQAVSGSNKPIVPVSLELAALYWQKWASVGNSKALSLIVALIKRSLYDRASEAFGLKCTDEERSSQLREDLSDEGQVRIEAMRQRLEPQTLSVPETSTERELKLKIRLRELELEVERLRQKTERYCFLPDETGASTVPGITSKAVLDDVLQILKTNDKEEAIRAIYKMGFGSRSNVWFKVEVKRWLFGMPNHKYHTLIQRLRQEVVGDPFEN